MSVQSSQSVTTEFTVTNPATGAAVNADSLPTGTLYLNGTANGATVTVTNISTGLYKAAVTLPTLAVDDVVSLVVTATVGGVTGKGKVWEDSKDRVILSDGVAHGGTPGSSTATLALRTLNLTNTTAGEAALHCESTAPGGGGYGVHVKGVGFGHAIFVEAVSGAGVLIAGGQDATLAGDGLIHGSFDSAGTAAIADKLLGRSIAGGADGGRTVRNALRPALNKVAFDVPAPGQYTCYMEDDVTPAFTGTYTRGAAGTGPLTQVDPA